jgi:hypothetical protein
VIGREMMKPNVGDRERLFRTILGVYAMLLGFLFVQGVVGIILGALGAVSLLTGITGWCGIYALMGKSTVTQDEPENTRGESAA